MPPKTSIKPYKLKATDGPLSRDDLSTWEYNQLSFSRQNEAWQEFLPGGTNSTWTATDEDETNELVVMKADGTGEDAPKTNKLRSAFKDFLTSVAVSCPTGFTETVQRESTSWKWIIDEIKNTFNLNTRGEQFLAGNDIKLEFDANFTYQQGYMYLRDFYSSSFLEKGKLYKGKVTTEKEKMSPTTEFFIIEKWLYKIDVRLPNHVSKTRGHLFNEARPTLACNQRILCDQIDTMLAELDGASSMSANNVNVGYVRAGRGFAGAPFAANRGLRGFRGQARGFMGPRQNRPTTPFNCHFCLEARRYDASITHPANRCQWVTQQRPQLKQPVGSGFKVLLVPTSPQPTQLQQPKPAQVQQAAYVSQLQNMSLEAQSQSYDDQFQYQDTSYYSPQDQLYSGQYEYQDYEDQNIGATDYTAPVYQPGTLEEIPQPQL